MWTKRIDFGGRDQFWGVRTDNQGYVYATGLVTRNTVDIVTMKFNPTNADLIREIFF